MWTNLQNIDNGICIWCKISDSNSPPLGDGLRLKYRRKEIYKHFLFCTFFFSCQGIHLYFNKKKNSPDIDGGCSIMTEWWTMEYIMINICFIHYRRWRCCGFRKQEVYCSTKLLTLWSCGLDTRHNKLAKPIIKQEYITIY